MAAKKKPPRVTKLRDLKKILRRYGIQYGPGGRHMRFQDDTGKKYPLPFTDGNDDVERDYVAGIRRKFGLTEEDGVSNEEFYKK